MFIPTIDSMQIHSTVENARLERLVAHEKLQRSSEMQVEVTSTVAKVESMDMDAGTTGPLRKIDRDRLYMSGNQFKRKQRALEKAKSGKKTGTLKKRKAQL